MVVGTAIHRFLNDLKSETGDDEPVLSIALSPKASMRFRLELFEQCKYINRDSFDESDKFVFLGVAVICTNLTSKQKE